MPGIIPQQVPSLQEILSEEDAAQQIPIHIAMGRMDWTCWEDSVPKKGRIELDLVTQKWGPLTIIHGPSTQSPRSEIIDDPEQIALALGDFDRKCVTEAVIGGTGKQYQKFEVFVRRSIPS